MSDVLEKLLDGYRSIICLNGECPGHFLKKTSLPIIAADGAANSLVSMGISPSVIVGDLDSVDPLLLQRYEYRLVKDQNSSDFEKAICYVKDNQLNPSIVTGVGGGFLDHILNNLSIWQKEEKLLYIAESMIGIIIQHDIEISLPLHTKLSIFGMPNAIVQSTGLKWELNDYSLDFWQQNSCYNRTISDVISLQVKSGRILVLFYTTPIMDCGSA